MLYVTLKDPYHFNAFNGRKVKFALCLLCEHMNIKYIKIIYKICIIRTAVKMGESANP